MAFIELQGVGKTYSSNGNGAIAPVLQDVNLAVEEGEFVSIVGPSGSGKSTLLTILGAMNRPTSGRVLIDGIAVYDLAVERRADFRHEYIGFVFQQLHLVPYLTAFENVMLPLCISSLPAGAQIARTREALERVKVQSKGHRLPGQLSGGEQERVAIARAIVNHPPLVLADEPTGSLDSKTGQEIMDLFRELNESLTIFMVTHNPESAGYSSRVIHLLDGRIVAQVQNYSDPAVAPGPIAVQSLTNGGV